MTTIPVEREKVERWLTGLQCGVISQRHVFEDLRALLAEQPQAGAGQDAVAILDDVREFCRQCGHSDVVRRIDALGAARHGQGDEVRRLREALESKVPLYEAVERACGELPDGWTIELHMERGAGWVELYDAEGIQVEGFPTDNERLDYTLNDAIDEALTHSQQGAKE